MREMRPLTPGETLGHDTPLSRRTRSNEPEAALDMVRTMALTLQTVNVLAGSPYKRRDTLLPPALPRCLIRRSDLRPPAPTNTRPYAADASLSGLHSTTAIHADDRAPGHSRTVRHSAEERSSVLTAMQSCHAPIR